MSRLLTISAAVLLLSFLLLTVRSVLAWLSLRQARHDAAPAVDAFKTRSLCLHPLGQEHRESAAELVKSIRMAQDLRAKVLAAMRDLKIPDPAMPPSYDELKINIAVAGTNYIGTLREIFKVRTTFKIIRLLKDEAKQRFFEEHLVFEHHTAVLSVLDQSILDALDQLGIVDCVHLALDNIFDIANVIVPDSVLHAAATHYAAEVAFLEDQMNIVFDSAVGELEAALADGIGHLADNALEIAMLPGMFQAAKSAVREFKMLVNDETSLADSLRFGLLPSLRRSIIIGIGSMIDFATGGLTMGMGTVCASLFAKYLNDRHIKDEIDRLMKRGQELMEAIQRRIREAQETVTRAAAEFLNAFKRSVDACPDIGDQPALRTFLNQLSTAYRNGLLFSDLIVTRQAQAIIQGLPARNWVDKLLWIDRSAAVETLYWDAVRQIHSVHLGLMNQFSLAAEQNIGEVLEFILRHANFGNEDTLTVLRTMKSVLLLSAEGYANDLLSWEKKCAEAWTDGTKNLEEVTKREHEAVDRFAAAKQAEMTPIRAAIKGHLKRLGQKTSRQ